MLVRTPGWPASAPYAGLAGVCPVRRAGRRLYAGLAGIRLYAGLAGVCPVPRLLGVCPYPGLLGVCPYPVCLASAVLRSARDQGILTRGPERANLPVAHTGGGLPAMT